MNWISPDNIRAKFSKLMSEMYQQEVPLYGDLINLVKNINCQVLDKNPILRKRLELTREYERLSEERHGAIRLGTAEELANIARIFAVMGMYPVGYYDLVPAGVPVHATAFRAVEENSLKLSPFRVFTSLLRLELIDDDHLRKLAEQTLTNRKIFTSQALSLTEKFEQQGGLEEQDAEVFINEVLETFRWHTSAPVTKEFYEKLNAQHRLIADVVAFRGPHINHLTPRTLDIDEVQKEMIKRDIPAKTIIEGPPTRECPILLRQTSFKALEENVYFQNEVKGEHTARFGEIEQRGVALTPKGRALYDQLLISTRNKFGGIPTDQNALEYLELLKEEFKVFPDSYAELQAQDLAYFYFILEKNPPIKQSLWTEKDLSHLIEQGFVRIEPIVYEDFLPVSAAGIFQSNLGNNAQIKYQISSNQELFEKQLQRKVLNSFDSYKKVQDASIQTVLTKINSEKA
ncbi:2-oxoadipate dioxygenase/decarboxylase HglS [Acinetobacter seifertii]|uniref:2-oxoadipate dioxygenase/decarboxylase HglS n=1 Tax=Acinetobacter seifertii TaxID=1530123 RepID=UPI00168B4CDC|nr:VOC family protein [Acinetobacter seifertii]QNX86599.1 VOC family protein [Acinetobacter seifertii]